ATVLANKADSGFVRNMLLGLRSSAAPPPAQDASITIDPSQTFQTMRGWEAVAQAGQHFSRSFDAYAPIVFDQAVDGGIDRLRLEVRAGSENRADSYRDYAAAGYPESGNAYETWRAKRYETINDNSDPNNINTSGFHFTEIDDTIDLVVNPLRARLAAKGESLYVNLNYVAFTRQITSGQYFHHAPAEYAEFMLATFQHIQQKYGWVPNAIEVLLEPDNVPQWSSGTLIGQAIVDTGQRLAAHGFAPDFIAPSTTCMNNTIRYFDALIAVANVKTYLKEIAYHRYCGVSVDNLQAIASRAEMHGLSTSMLEWWSGGNNHRVLHEDLKVGRNSAWEQGTLASPGSAPTALYLVNDSNALSPVVTTGGLTRYSSQYYRHIRQGARRIGATSSAPALDPLAFVNVNGTYVVVVNALNAGSFSVQNLPAGTYGIRYTTAGESVSHADQTIVSGQRVTASIPAAGVLTVYGTSAGPTPAPPPGDTPAPTPTPTPIPPPPPHREPTPEPSPEPPSETVQKSTNSSVRKPKVP
ncbi:MAG: hypothetical protein ACRD1H_08160, partial [Vicinamibacterales bacterium]